MTTMLTARCDRRGHLMFQVDLDDGQYFISAPRYALGRSQKTWTPMRRPLVVTGIRMTRYGCACGLTVLTHDKMIRDDLRRGETQWVIRAANLPT